MDKTAGTGEINRDCGADGERHGEMELIGDYQMASIFY